MVNKVGFFSLKKRGVQGDKSSLEMCETLSYKEFLIIARKGKNNINGQF